MKSYLVTGDSYIDNLYDNEDKKIMQLAIKTRANGQSRIDEIKRYITLAGIERVGIAYCRRFHEFSEILKEILKKQGLEVFSIDCKCGMIPNQVFLKNVHFGISCNPSGQAEHLDGNNTQLNISMGLCLGHDMIFNKKSKALVTTLLVKDRTNQHMPTELLKP